MSMQRIANYGSFLQAYALKQLIEELGCKVEFVDYHVGAPVITENADSKNKFVRKVEKGLETFRYQAPFAHKLSFIHYKQFFSQKYAPCILYDLDGYYTGLRMLLGHMIETGLSSEERQEGIYFAKDLAEIKAILSR